MPRKLVDEALSVSTKTESPNLNKLVTIALEEYIENKRRKKFEEQMVEMGCDPQILQECSAINTDFASTELDGLRKIK